MSIPSFQTPPLNSRSYFPTNWKSWFPSHAKVAQLNKFKGIVNDVLVKTQAYQPSSSTRNIKPIAMLGLLCIVIVLVTLVIKIAKNKKTP